MKQEKRTAVCTFNSTFGRSSRAIASGCSDGGTKMVNREAIALMLAAIVLIGLGCTRVEGEGTLTVARGAESIGPGYDGFGIDDVVIKAAGAQPYCGEVGTE